jgi:hypothetical protein
MIVEQTFDSMFNGKCLHIDTETVKSILQKLGYTVGRSQFGINAIRWEKDHRYRYHVTITQLPDGEIDKLCSVNFHKDAGHNGNEFYYYHKTTQYGDEIEEEFQKIKDELFNVFSRRRHNQKKRERKNVRISSEM